MLRKKSILCDESNIADSLRIEWSKNLYMGTGSMKERSMERAKEQLLLNISEILAQRGLISEEEKLRMREQILSPAQDRT